MPYPIPDALLNNMTSLLLLHSLTPFHALATAQTAHKHSTTLTASSDVTLSTLGGLRYIPSYVDGRVIKSPVPSSHHDRDKDLYHIL